MQVLCSCSQKVHRKKILGYFNSFQKAYKSAFLVRFVVSVMLHIHPRRVSWLHGFGTEMPGMYSQIGLPKQDTS